MTKFAALFALTVLLMVAQQPATPELQYTKDGSFVFPQNYRDWNFVTSGLGMSYGPAGRADAGGHVMFDNVFAAPSAYKSYQENGTWPDKTVLILELRGSDSKVSINQGGNVQTSLMAVEAHVKDSAKGGWAFYGFRPGETTAKMIPKTQDCYSCHEQKGSVDTTFVQFYPTLIEIAKKKGTFKNVDR